MAARSLTVEEVRLLLSVKDQVSGPLKQVGVTSDRVRTGLASAAAASALFMRGVGDSWDKATKTIVDATGATKEKLDELRADYQAVAGEVNASLGQVSKAIGDLNTHTDLSGEALQTLATKALKAGVNTDTLGKTFRSFNIEGAEQAETIDKLVVLGQVYGAGVNRLQTDIGRYKDDLATLNLTTDEHLVLGALALSENRQLRDVVSEIKSGQGGWNEKIREALPLLQDVTGRTEEAYEAERNWRDTLKEVTNSVRAQLGPYGDVISALSSVLAAAAFSWPAIVGIANKAAVGIRVAMGVATGPIGWIVTALAAVGAAAWAFRDEIAAALGAVLRFVQPWVDAYIGYLQVLARAADKILGTDMEGMLQSARDSLAKMADDSKQWGQDVEKAAGEAGEGIIAAGEAAANAAPDIASVGDAGDAAAKGLKEGTEAAKEWFETLENGGQISGMNPFSQAVNDIGRAGAIGGDFLRNNSDALNAGLDTAKAFQAGMLQGADAIRTTVLPKVVGAVSELPTWEKSGLKSAKGMLSGLGNVFSSGNIGQTLVNAFEGGGGFGEAIRSLGAQSGTALANSLGSQFSGLASGIAGKFTGIFGQALSSFLPGLGSLIGPALGKLFSLFKKPNEAELAARKQVDDYTRTVVAGLSGAQLEEAAKAAQGAWQGNEQGAQFLIRIRDAYVAAGKTAAQAEADVQRYWDAIKKGDTATLDNLQGQFDAVLNTQQEVAEAAEDATQHMTEVTEAAEDATQHMTVSADEVARQFQGLTDEEAEKLTASIKHLGVIALHAFTDIHHSAIAAGNALADSFIPGVAAAEKALDGLLGKAGNVAGTLEKAAGDALANDVDKAIGKVGRLAGKIRGVLGGKRGTIGDIGDGSGIQARAHGGPVTAGRAYLVGERGPEVVVPAQSGQVIPDGGMQIDYGRLGEAVAAALRKEPPVVSVDGRRIAETAIRFAPRAARTLI